MRVTSVSPSALGEIVVSDRETSYSNDRAGPTSKEQAPSNNIQIDTTVRQRLKPILQYSQLAPDNKQTPRRNHTTQPGIPQEKERILSIEICTICRC
jgi:hypothetical protein